MITSYSKTYSYLFQIGFLALLIGGSPFFLETSLSNSSLLRFSVRSFPYLALFFFLLRGNLRIDKAILMYVGLMIICIFTHSYYEGIQSSFLECSRWITIILFIALFKVCNKNNYIIFLAFILFFILECGIAIYEKIYNVYLVPFRYKEISGNFSDEILDFVLFRSHSLILHPLHNANVVSICMAFILCSKWINKYIKICLFLLGCFALWGFNSRGVMVIWMILLVYRLFFYNSNLWKVALMSIIFYWFFPIIIDIIIQSQVLGRLDFDFSDGSSATRFDAFRYFANQRWDLDWILFGGKLIKMPGSDLYLENGILLSMGYWGWFWGLAKPLLEILVTYRCLSNYSIKDKLIIMAATWLVALTNNNTMGGFVLLYFMLSNFSFNSRYSFDKCNKIFNIFVDNKIFDKNH